MLVWSSPSVSKLHVEFEQHCSFLCPTGYYFLQDMWVLVQSDMGQINQSGDRGGFQLMC